MLIMCLSLPNVRGLLACGEVDVMVRVAAAT
jgi:hypothetical protein